MPAEPALLAEAARWVDRWQEPTGHTNYDAALRMAERYMEADCAYIFSDGLSDYALVLLEVTQSPCVLTIWLHYRIGCLLCVIASSASCCTGLLMLSIPQSSIAVILQDGPYLLVECQFL